MLVPLALAGCGGGSGGSSTGRPAAQRSSETASVVAVARAYSRAVYDREGRTFCSLLTAHARQQFMADFAGSASSSSDCPATAVRAFQAAGAAEHRRAARAVRELAPRDVRLQGAQATIALPTGRRLRLTRAAGRWLVADTRLSS